MFGIIMANTVIAPNVLPRQDDRGNATINRLHADFHRREPQAVVITAVYMLSVAKD